MCECQLPVGVAVGGAELPVGWAELPVGGTGVLESWQAIVDDNLTHTEEDIRVRGHLGLRSCASNHYYCRKVQHQHFLVFVSVTTVQMI